MGKDVLTPLVLLTRIIEYALSKWVRSRRRDRTFAWTLPLCAYQSLTHLTHLAVFVLWLTLLPASHADIYRWPATSEDSQTFVERADAARIPAEVLTHDPLAPTEPEGPTSSFLGLAQLRNRPDWAPADTVTPVSYTHLTLPTKA